MKYLMYIATGLLGVILFVVLAQTSQNYTHVLTTVTQQVGLWGVLAYIGSTILAIVIAPLGTGFLLPIAANSFGPSWAAIYSIAGWMVGSLIAFFLARRYGQRFVHNTTLIQKIHRFEHNLSPTSFFFLLVILRLVLPVDLMSYALGLGSSVTYGTFAITTLVGISPFAFLFSYAAVSSVNIQIVVSTIGMVAFLIGIYFVYDQHKRTNKEKA